MPYANKIDIINYGIPEEELPIDIEKKIEKASDLIECMVLNNVINGNENHSKVLSLATCAQIEYWIEFGEDFSSMGINNFSLGDLSMNIQSNRGMLSPKSRMYLNKEGLLYRGL